MARLTVVSLACLAFMTGCSDNPQDETIQANSPAAITATDELVVNGIKIDPNAIIDRNGDGVYNQEDINQSVLEMLQDLKDGRELPTHTTEPVVEQSQATKVVEAKSQETFNPNYDYSGLDTLIENGTVDAMLQVAQCEYSTESYLLKVLKYAKENCEHTYTGAAASFGKYTNEYDYHLAKAVLDNPNANETVLSALSEFPDANIVYLAAQSAKATEKTLIKAIQTAKENYEHTYTGAASSFGKYTNEYDYHVAKAVIENPNVTKNCLTELQNFPDAKIIELAHAQYDKLFNPNCAIHNPAR